MRGFLILIMVLALVGCNTTKKVSSHTEATSGNVTDSTSGVTVAVDSTAWTSEHGATIATSTQYAVVTDGDGRPIFDDAGRPITYVTRRDTVTKVVKRVCKEKGVPMLPFNAGSLADGTYVDEYNSFYDQL